MTTYDSYKGVPLDKLAEDVKWWEYCNGGCPMSLSNRLCVIHEETRWIPVSERMPTKEDGDSMGLVFVWHDTSSPLLKAHGYVAHYHWVPASDEGITHWKRIQAPEGV